MIIKQRMENHSLIEKIKNANSDKELKEVYFNYRREFLKWAVRNTGCSFMDAKEIYQQTMIIFYENIVSEKITILTSHVKTYIFGIGKNKLMEFIRDKEKAEGISDNEVEIEEGIYLNVFDDEYEEKLKGVESSLDRLGDPCKSILEMYYYHDKTMDEISDILKYKNPHTVRNLKYKCLLRLKEIFTTEFSTLN